MEIMLYNRPVVIESISGDDPYDSYAEKAYFDDDGTYLTETELNSITNMYYWHISDLWFNQAIEHAEILAEGTER